MFIRKNFAFNKLLKMAECFFPTRAIAVPPVFVLSKIPELADKLKNVGVPYMQLKNVPVLDTSEIDEEHISSLREAEILLCDVDLLVKNYKNMPNLKWAHSTFAGVEPLFKAFSQEPPFTITRHRGDAFGALMAEYVVCQILNCERNFKICWRNQDSKTWERANNVSYRSLDQITVAILGAGNMGTAIARFLKQRGSTIHGFTRRDRSRSEYDVFDKMSHDIVHIIKDCDYLCNTLPSTPLTNRILNTTILQNCEKSPVLINVGRGNIISEEDIVQSLKNGFLSGAVLDVFDEEPLPASSQLWDMPQVTITPHVSAVSKPEHVAEEFAEVYNHYINETCILPKYLVNWSAGY